MIRGAFVLLIAVLVSAGGCGPRVNLTTGTTIGLKATPGDGSTRPPQVTLGYKRAELSLVPTEGTGTTKDKDAASTLASIHFSTRWFQHTELDSFVAAGAAARKLVEPSSGYPGALAAVALGLVPEAIQQRRVRLAGQADGLTEVQAERILTELRYATKAPKTAKESLKDYVLDANTDALVERLESAFFRLR